VFLLSNPHYAENLTEGIRLRVKAIACQGLLVLFCHASSHICIHVASVEPIYLHASPLSIGSFSSFSRFSFRLHRNESPHGVLLFPCFLFPSPHVLYLVEGVLFPSISLHFLFHWQAGKQTSKMTKNGQLAETALKRWLFLYFQFEDYLFFFGFLSIDSFFPFFGFQKMVFHVFLRTISSSSSSSSSFALFFPSSYYII
jgi:hypothetical protein